MRTRKYRFMITAERVNNRITRALLLRGWAPRWFSLLETTGRRSRQPRHTPVSAGMRPGETTFWLIAAHGDQADYVRNIRHDPRVRIKFRGHWMPGVATILPDDDTRGRSDRLPYRWDAVLGRAMASRPLTIRIDLASP